MSFDPRYGETPLEADELDALLPGIRALFEDSPAKAEVYDLEQAIQIDVAQQFLTLAQVGQLTLDELLSDRFVRQLHERLYAGIWSWAGRFRRREINLGVAPEAISTELRASLDNVLYRWEATNDFSPRELGIVAHAELVRVHPFVDGNGRSSRLLADLVFTAAQAGDRILFYDWNLDKPTYIELLREYDVHRNPGPLAAFVPVVEEP